MIKREDFEIRFSIGSNLLIENRPEAKIIAFV